MPLPLKTIKYPQKRGSLDLRPYDHSEHMRFCYVSLMDLIAKRRAARTPEQAELARKGMSWGVAAGWIKQQ